MTSKLNPIGLLLIIAACLVTLLCFFACDLAKDTADTAKQDGDGAVGIAEKMSKGSLGDELDSE